MEPLDFLAHYGIKGMRWGLVRKRGENGRVNSKSTTPAKPSKPDSEDHTRTRALTANHKSTLTNKELQDVITRMNLEQQYRNLAPTKANQAKRVVKDVGTLGKTYASVAKFVKSPAGKAIGKGIGLVASAATTYAISKAVGSEELMKRAIPLVGR